MIIFLGLVIIFCGFSLACLLIYSQIMEYKENERELNKMRQMREVVCNSIDRTNNLIDELGVTIDTIINKNKN